MTYFSDTSSNIQHRQLLSTTYTVGSFESDWAGNNSRKFHAPPRYAGTRMA